MLGSFHCCEDVTQVSLTCVTGVGVGRSCHGGLVVYDSPWGGCHHAVVVWVVNFVVTILGWWVCESVSDDKQR